MNILTMPTTPGFRSCSFRLRASTQSGVETLSKSPMTRTLPGQRWAATYELPPMTRAQAAAWCAFLARLNGRAGRFYGYSPSGQPARGTVAGTPLVNGANQTGRELVTDGWTVGTIPFLAGDYLAFATPSGWRELHKVMEDTLATGSLTYDENGYGTGGYGYGESWPAIEPPIRESPNDNAAVIVTLASCIMRLVDDGQAAWDVDTAMHYGLRFSAEEVWEGRVAPVAEGALTAGTAVINAAGVSGSSGAGVMAAQAASLAGAGTVA